MATPKYDVERFCADLKTILAASLNTKISEINSEKNDSTTLAAVDSNAYFFQELNGRATNFDPFVLYSVEEIQSEGTGPTTSITPTVHVVLVLADGGQDTESVAVRMLRYQRALREVFEENWTSNKYGVKLRISSMVPVQFSLMNSANPFRAIGVSVSGSIA